MTELYRPDVTAGKYDPSKFDPTGRNLLVNEIFYTIQGEGANAGRAAIFVRFAKCNLACKFCDTEFETFTTMAVEDVVTAVLNLCPTLPPGVAPGRPRYAARPLVVLTGGEPGLQNLGPLLDRLNEEFYTCLETSGSVWAEWMSRCFHVCVSPKVPLARVPAELTAEANEFKWVVNAALLAMFEKDPNQCYQLGPDNYLQPESMNPKWTAAAVKLCQRWPWRYRMSVQTHKVIGVP